MSGTFLIFELELNHEVTFMHFNILFCFSFYKTGYLKIHMILCINLAVYPIQTIILLEMPTRNHDCIFHQRLTYLYIYVHVHVREVPFSLYTVWHIHDVMNKLLLECYKKSWSPFMSFVVKEWDATPCEVTPKTKVHKNK